MFSDICGRGLIMLTELRATAQTAAAKTAPTAADWSALAKLPDFTGVWEIGLGGGGGGTSVGRWKGNALFVRATLPDGRELRQSGQAVD
jgi:hypothetical protein